MKTMRVLHLLAVLTVLLGSGVVFTVVTEAQTIHALAVIMDGDPVNPQQYETNARWVQDMLIRGKNLGIFEVNSTTLHSAKDLKDPEYPTSERVLSWISEVIPRKNDVVFIYYCGHGASDNGGDYFDLVGERLYEVEVVNTLKRSQAGTCRLQMLIADTCRVDTSLKSHKETITPNPAPGYKARRAYTHLFVEHEGFLHLASTSPGQPSWGDSSNGGWFTNGLIRSIHSHPDANSRFVGWNEIFAMAEKEVATFLEEHRNIVGTKRQHPEVRLLPKRVTDPEKWEDKDMVLIPAGEFQMGSNNGYNNEKPVHTVYLDAFYMDTHEVTNAQYKEFVDANPEWQKGGSLARGYANADYLKPWNGNTYPKGRADHPVVWVSWYAAMAYAEWAGKRLPTEAEWEKAARGGWVGTPYPWGDSALNSRKANYGQRWRGAIGTMPVGSYASNRYGLYDMVGNVYEWCLDRWDPYSTSPRQNPVAGAGSISEITSAFLRVGTERSIRGGAWTSQRKGVRVANRAKGHPTNTHYTTGFRCAN